MNLIVCRLRKASLMKVLHVVGARPSLSRGAGEQRSRGARCRGAEGRGAEVSDGQHYDNMSRVFFEHLKLPQPDIYLGVGSGSHAQQTARIMLALWNRPLLQGLSWKMYSTGLAFEPVQEETNEYASSCNEKGRGSTSATLEGRNRYR